MDPVFIKLDIKKYWAVSKRGYFEEFGVVSFQFRVQNVLHEIVCALLAEKCSKGTSMSFLAKMLPGETLCNFFQIFPPKDFVYILRKSLSHLLINKMIFT